MEHEFYDFPFSWEWNNHPNCYSVHHFSEGLVGSTTNQYMLGKRTTTVSLFFFISFFNGDIMGIARRMGKFSHELWVFRSAGKSSNYGWWMFQQAT